MNTTNITTLRGLGRYAYRHGMMSHQAITHARAQLGRDLNDTDRAYVIAGWRAERQDMFPGSP